MINYGKEPCDRDCFKNDFTPRGSCEMYHYNKYDTALTFDKMQECMDIIQNEGWRPTHYVFDQGFTDTVVKYCKDNNLTTFHEFVLHLAKGLLENLSQSHPLNNMDV